MDEQTKDALDLQSVVNYYRNKCSDLEYQFILYQAKVETKIKEFEKRLDTSGPVKSEATESKKRKSNEKT
jgi:hypothetical protein